MKTKRVPQVMIVIVAILCSYGSPRAQWVSTGGPLGGSVQCSIAAEGNLFIGTSAGGVYKSTDNGRSWSACPSAMSSVKLLAARSGEVLAAAGEGLFSSKDNGATWKEIDSGLKIGSYLILNALTVTPNAIFTVANGRGVFRSTDDGATWKSANSGLPAEPSTLITMGNVVLAGTISGLARTANDGATWTLPATIPANSIASLLQDGDRVYAFTYSAGVYRSNDSGNTWTMVDTAVGHSNVRAAAAIGLYLIADNGEGVYRSSDAGASWVAVNSWHGDSSALTLTVTGPTVIAGSHKGLFLSTDSGATWNASDSGLTAESVSSLAVSEDGVLAGLWGDGLAQTTGTGGHWLPITNGLPAQMSVVNVAASNGYLFAAADAVYRSHDAGRTWTTLDPMLSGRIINVMTAANGALFIGGDGEFRSTDNGDTWTPITRGIDSGSVFGLTGNGTDLYAGTLDGRIYRSTNNGDSWTYQSRQLTKLSLTYGFAAHNHTLVVGTIGNGMYRSTDDGKTWNNILTGFNNLTVYYIINYNNYFFAASFGYGVLMSSDDGVSWRQVNTGLTTNYVRTLSSGLGYLFAGTLGNGVWRRSLSEIINGRVLSGPAMPQASLTIYPNPATTNVHVDVTSVTSGNAEVSIYNQLGVEVARLFNGILSSGDRSFVWDASTASQGTYYCVIRENRNVKCEAVEVKR